MPMKVRIAAKQVEKKLLSMANEIKQNPYKVLPECGGDCGKCYFEKLKKEIERLEDKKYAEKVARKKGFLGALAATMLLAEQKIPYVAFIKMGDENVYYAKRGKAKDELLVGLQNWDKPHVRLLAYLDIAKKKKVNLFSMPDKIICSKEPPEEFLRFLQKKFSCDENEYTKIKWRDIEIKACSDRNTIAEMKKYFYYPNFEKEVKIEVKTNVVECVLHCSHCLIEDVLEQDIDSNPYINGVVSDKKFLENYRKKILWNIESKKVFIIGNKCYGDDTEAFLKELEPKEWEMEAVMEILKNENKAIILETASATKLLEKYDVDLQKLKEEYYEKKKEERLKNLPVVKGDRIAEFVDSLARIYKVEGKEGVIRAIKSKKMDIKEKAISYAFLYALGVKGEEWKYTKMEIDFGKHLAGYVGSLLKAEGEEYKKMLDMLLREVG